MGLPPGYENGQRLRRTPERESLFFVLPVFGSDSR